jgi:hypothetical protein
VRADGQAIRNPRLFRGLVVALPAFGGILWARFVVMVFSARRVVRGSWTGSGKRTR